MKEIVLSQQEISAICKRLGKEITQALASDKEAPVLCCVMNGAVNFMVDLMREIDVPVLFDYVQISSWEGTSSTGEVKFIKDLSLDITGRTLVIVEDIVDTGLSMHALLEHINKTRKPKRILVATLFDKAVARKVPVQVDFVGMRLTENKFLVGYGLDYKGLLRNVPYVYVPTEEEIASFDELAKMK